jgi:hypothetical protein
MNALIINTLNDLAPTAYLKYRGSETTYITFFEYNQNGALSADDEELYANHSYQVDIFSKGNYINLIREVKSKLKGIGFTRTFETEFYENDTGLYHKVLRFYYVMKNEEE